MLFSHNRLISDFMLDIRRTIMLLALLLLLNGCSLMRLGYNQGPQLAWWWIDSYLDFNQEQTPHAKQVIHNWFSWHRTTQLPEYADWLASVRSQIDGSLTSTQVCNWSGQLQNMLIPAFDQAVQLGTPLILQLKAAQLHHLEQRYSESNSEFRSDFLQPDLNERKQASVKRTIKRIENLYGDIDKRQQHLIATSIENSPFNPEAWMIERQRRQQDTLRTLRQLISETTSSEQPIASLRKLIEHTHRSNDPEYRAYQLKLTEYTCNFIARMHNLTTPPQRRHAHDKLKGWEIDMRMLIAENPINHAVLK